MVMFLFVFVGGYLHWRNYLRATRKLGFLEINPLNCTPWPAKTGRDTGKSGATTWPVASCSASHACCWCYLFDNFLIYFDIRILVSEIVCFHAWPVNISSHHPLLKQIPFDAMLFPSLFDRLIDLVFLWFGRDLSHQKNKRCRFHSRERRLSLVQRSHSVWLVRQTNPPPGWNSDFGPAWAPFKAPFNH